MQSKENAQKKAKAATKSAKNASTRKHDDGGGGVIGSFTENMSHNTLSQQVKGPNRLDVKMDHIGDKDDGLLEQPMGQHYGRVVTKRN